MPVTHGVGRPSPTSVTVVRRVPAGIWPTPSPSDVEEPIVPTHVETGPVIVVGGVPEIVAQVDAGSVIPGIVVIPVVVGIIIMVVVVVGWMTKPSQPGGIGIVVVVVKLIVIPVIIIGDVYVSFRSCIGLRLRIRTCVGFLDISLVSISLIISLAGVDRLCCFGIIRRSYLFLRSRFYSDRGFIGAG